MTMTDSTLDKLISFFKVDDVVATLIIVFAIIGPALIVTLLVYLLGMLPSSTTSSSRTPSKSIETASRTTAPAKKK